MRGLAWFVVLVAVGFSGPAPTSAKPRADTLIVVAGIADAKLVAEVAKDARRFGHRLVELPTKAVDIAVQLKAEIEDDHIAEDGLRAPAHLRAFSGAVLAAIPDLFDYHYVRIISEQMLPLEMVRTDRGFLGDVAEIAHEFPASGVRPFVEPRGRKLAMSRYIIDAVIGMPTGLSRADQDIVRVALKLEREIPVDLSFGGSSEGLTRLLARGDVSILHIDTHGGPGGRSIQVSREGGMLDADNVAFPVKAPVVLLFGCEGVASQQSFGAILRARGAEAVISSFAKFNSYGLTGDSVREQQIYEAFFWALRSGQTVGAALVSLRQAAQREARMSPQGVTLTRLLFVLVGRDDLAFAWPKVPGP
jgi:hypothetical protein